MVVPFIDLLFKFKFRRRKEGLAGGKKVSLFDKLHDKKAGTPIGGGILLITVITFLFAILFPSLASLGINIRSSFPLGPELLVVFFTFISFGLIGLLDDLIKIFGKPKPGKLGSVFGLTKVQKFGLQWFFAFIIAFFLYQLLGIKILHIPFLLFFTSFLPSIFITSKFPSNFICSLKFTLTIV